MISKIFIFSEFLVFISLKNKKGNLLFVEMKIKKFFDSALKQTDENKSVACLWWKPWESSMWFTCVEMCINSVYQQVF